MLELVEGGHFGGRHWAALQQQRLSRVIGELVKIGGVHGAKIAFGRYVQPHGFRNIIAKQLGKNVRARLLVQIIDALLRQIYVVADEEVAQIVEQGGDHQRIAETAFGGEVGRLQRMLFLADGREAIASGAAVVQQLENAVRVQVHGPPPGMGSLARASLADLLRCRPVMINRAPARYPARGGHRALSSWAGKGSGARAYSSPERARPGPSRGIAAPPPRSPARCAAGGRGLDG